MRLLIVDDDLLIRQSLKATLGREADITVVDTAANGTEALSVCETHTPDIVLMDIRMPGMDGIAATRLIKTRFPQIRVMMLTTFDDRPNIIEALTAGAEGYLLKTDQLDRIADKLRTLMSGAGVLTADVLKKLAPQPDPALAQLTPRELDITRLVAQGLANKEIAAQLFLSEGTVRNNIVVIMEKLGVTNRTQLSIKYLSN